ncbi:PH domain-containing protein [Corynebacterium pygosceleis]|uniref:PH domain-containing protein n=1 Tax=Corynebacterium pygosceleis TaxID=2800406 RepID=A0A9Q4GK24_9CORY|nr:PH domain-containing protein [Corynebacterium pygosceleis]MCK7636984.1 PH domain-containing protein [Corynebacterium pygosceleis]MCK7674458.1 PH domain-containing protein [Corynebacterium pygosceleis]MCL0120244.1 PH domain-containing protein [Corynebacterium pygosceleis]MCX7443791.1 PH domain-containing protein [Corynebacterium pygosceleis]MCX7467737.1 PH domain-containing protein [Corynebacterium pygosceleis]
MLAADTPTTTGRPWELVVTSRRLRVLAVVAVIVVMAVHVFMAFAVAVGDTGAAVTTVDQWSFVGVGLVLSFCCIGIARPRVRANADGVEVRNFIGTRFYPWSVIYGLSFPKGARWARLELPEFEFVPMWAFQSADGEAVVRAVADFRGLEDAYMPED